MGNACKLKDMSKETWIGEFNITIYEDGSAFIINGDIWFPLQKEEVIELRDFLISCNLTPAL